MLNVFFQAWCESHLNPEIPLALMALNILAFSVGVSKFISRIMINKMLSLLCFIQNSSYDWLLLCGRSGILWWHRSAGPRYGSLRRRKHRARHAGKDQITYPCCCWNPLKLEFWLITWNVDILLFKTELKVSVSSSSWNCSEECCEKSWFLMRHSFKAGGFFVCRATQKVIITNPLLEGGDI